MQLSLLKDTHSLNIQSRDFTGFLRSDDIFTFQLVVVICLLTRLCGATDGQMQAELGSYSGFKYWVSTSGRLMYDLHYKYRGSL